MPTATGQAETREIQESLSIAFEHTPIGLALLSPEGRWLKVNQALCDLVGYSEAELLARTFRDITPPGEIEAGREDGRRLMAGETRSCEFQKHYVHQRGHLIAVSITLSLVRDGEGQPCYFIALTQDITERERAESALQESRRFARATLDALSSHVAILDEHGVIVEVNAAWDRFADQACFSEGRCGVGDNYLESCDAASADSSKGASALSCGIRAVMAGQRDEFQLEYPCHGPKEQRWLLVHVTRFGGDGPVRVVVAHENITERKQAELALNESQLRHRSLFENMLEGYVYCRVVYQGGRPVDYVYLEINNTFESLTGLKNVVGRKVSDIIPGIHQSNPEQLDVYSRVAATGIPEKFESYAKGLDIWFSVSVYSYEKEHFVAVFDNITERKRADTNLRFNEQRFRSLVEATAAIVWDMPASGQFEAEQPAWTALTGQSFKELHGWGWLKAVHPDDRAETERVWTAALANSSIYKVEHRLRARDGTYRNMMVRALPILADDGTVHQWIGNHTDITERKQAEAWRARLAAIIESSDDAIVGKDLNSNVTSWNAAAERVFGYSAGEIVGTSIRRLIPPDRQGEEDRIMSSIQRGEPVLPFEAVRLTKSGTPIDVSVTVSPIKDAAGKVVGASKIARDITEHKRAEAELRWKTAFLEAQVGSSLDGVLVVDGQGKKLLQNQRVTDLLKIPQHIADDKDDEKQLLWVKGMTKDPAAFIEKVAHLFSHPNEIGRDEIELKNGTILDRYSAPVVGDDGAYFGRIWTFRDVTDRKRTEARFRRLSESNMQGILFWTVTGGITGANDAFLSLTGYSREDLEAGQINWVKLTPPEYAHLDRRALEEIAAHGVCTPYEKEYVRKDGSRVPILLGSTAFADNPEEGVCFVLDRTDLLASQTRFSAFMEDAPALVYMKDEEGRFLYGNRTLLHHFGLRSEEFLGKTDFDFWPEATPALREVDAQVLASGTAVETNESVPLSDGSMSRWLSYKFPLRDESTGQKILAGISVDITERERAEAALRREREFLAALLDKLQAGVVACDDHGRITHCNRAAITLHGLPADGPLPPLDRWSQYFDLLPENAAEPLRDDAGPLASALRGEVLQDREFLVRPRNGPERILSVNATPFADGDGHLLGAVAVIHDVTVRRQARQQALRALHEKEILLQEIHHRVKNNLQIIGSLLSMQSRRTKSPDALEALRESANRVRSIALVHEKLYGSTDLDSVGASDYLRTLSRNLTETLGMELRPLKERRLSLDFELEDGRNLDASTAINCGLIVNEALTNSFKHGFPDERTGRLTVALREWTGEPVPAVSRGPAGAGGPAVRWLRLEIRDNGVGVPAAAFTAAGTLDLVSKSLGMRLIQDLSEQIGGRLEFVPTDAGTGAGLTLRLTFPVLEGRLPAREETARAISASSTIAEIP